MIFINILNSAIQIKKILIVFDDMTADRLSNKKCNPIVTELFIRVRKLNIYVVFITQSTHCFVMKIPNKRGLQRIAFNHSSDVECKNVMNLYKKCTAKPYSFLVIDATLASDNLPRFRKSILKRTLKLIMTIDYKIRDEKLQHNINK